MTLPGLIDVRDLIAQADLYSNLGDIDSVDNMAGQPVFIWTGTSDSAVNPGDDIWKQGRVSRSSPRGHPCSSIGVGEVCLRADDCKEKDKGREIHIGDEAYKAKKESVEICFDFSVVCFEDGEVAFSARRLDLFQCVCKTFKFTKVALSLVPLCSQTHRTS